MLVYIRAFNVVGQGYRRILRLLQGNTKVFSNVDLGIEDSSKTTRSKLSNKATILIVAIVVIAMVVFTFLRCTLKVPVDVPPKSLYMLEAHQRLVHLLLLEGKVGAEIETLQIKSRKFAEDTFGKSHNRTQSIVLNLANILNQNGKVTQARKIY